MKWGSSIRASVACLVSALSALGGCSQPNTPACGSPGGPCCIGSTCNASLVCTAGVCGAAITGGCDGGGCDARPPACGANGQLCCTTRPQCSDPLSACALNGTCVNASRLDAGTDAACGLPGNPCADAAVDASSCDSGACTDAQSVDAASCDGGACSDAQSIDAISADGQTLDATNSDASSTDTQSCDGGACMDAVASDVQSCDGASCARDAAMDTNTAQLFAQCTTNAMCASLGVLARCDTRYPGGICTRRCTTSATCGSAGVCFAGSCVPACTDPPPGSPFGTPGGLECDQFGSGCTGLSTTDPTVLGCLPTCMPPPRLPLGNAPPCAANVACDPYSGTCGGMPFGTGANGDPCTANTDCRGGFCRTELDPTTNMPTGWLDGYCESFGYAPDVGSQPMGSAIPNGTCPNGSGPFVFFTNVNTGDITECWKLCTADADCRAGYTCDHLAPTANPSLQYFSNGYCVPENCTASGARPCPPPTRCTPLPSDAATPPGQCQR